MRHIYNNALSQLSWYCYVAEAYEAELERLSTTIREQNVTLAHDNKQLANLVREYEATLEAVMAKFRQSAVSGAPCIVSLPV